MIDIKKKGKGYLPRAKDPRDVPFSAFMAGEEVDWDAGYDIRDFLVLKVEDQGTAGSCVAQAWSKYVEVKDKMETGVPVDMSARDLYSRIYIPPDGGAWGYKGGSVLKDRGLAEERLVNSYVNGVPLNELEMRVKDDSAPVTQNAAIRKILGYTVVSENIDEMALAIKRNTGAVFGMTGTNEGWGSAFIRHPISGEVVWGHFIFGIGFKKINGKKYIIFLNSWSNQWGENGYGYVSEEYFTSGFVFSGYTIQDLPNDWQKQIEMKDVIKLANQSDQWLVSKGKRYLIPDEETLKLLVELEIITGTPRSVSNDEFARYPEGGRVPSAKIDAAILALKDSVINQ